ncbi:MAG: hypothetical protein GW941_00760 [Candidatus Pacebacteria bacterium]|nr:hypothetical protein [Candidatus Paceibacterota bacterium]
MAKNQIYQLSQIYQAGGYPKWYHLIHHGECTSPQYRGLWFVSIPPGQYDFREGNENHWPEEMHTFLIPAKYATQFYFSEWRRDVDQWAEVAVKTIIGDWCAKYECLWRERPVFSLTLKDGTQVKYGLNGTQSKKQPKRELWFVSLTGPALQDSDNSDCETFFVDQICATPEVIQVLGSDWINGWQKICWCHLICGLKWDDIGSGKPEDWTINKTWSLDSPFIPSSVETALQFVEGYKLKQKEADKPRKWWHF